MYRKSADKYIGQGSSIQDGQGSSILLVLMATFLLGAMINHEIIEL